MKLYLTRILSIYRKNERSIIIFILFGLSFLAFNYFYFNNQTLLYGDALSRLNISRKIFDNLTPGFAQLGNVWLPIPQLFMLPFIWNNFLWHSGIAAAIMSMTSFIVGGYFIYRCVKLLTSSIFAAFFGLAIYALNINILYLQTTAMSESIFLCSISIGVYFLILWAKEGTKMQHLILAAIAVSTATLIRYEALALLLSSIPAIYIYKWYATKQRKEAESSFIMYSTLACLGFFFWTVYLWTIFGDPLYWKNYYITDTKTPSTVAQFQTHLSFGQAFITYITSIVWMNGLLPSLMAICGMGYLVFHSIVRKKYYLLSALLPLSIFAFMILTLQKNTPIGQPDLNIENLLSPLTSKIPEFNLRYGILMLPLIALMCGYLFQIRNLAFRSFLMALFLMQIVSYFQISPTLIYQIPVSISDTITQGKPRDRAAITWFKTHYKGGLILMSAARHDPQMFQLGINYASFIHEGTSSYWQESLTSPQKYATWIYIDYQNREGVNDRVTKALKDSPLLDKFYDKVYDQDGMYIYKIKSAPQISLK